MPTPSSISETRAIARASGDRPVVIAGPTASGKSALAMRIAAAHGGVVVNADAMQVHAAWRILTARPTAADEAAVPHALFGHVETGATYSVGHWLREVAALRGTARPIIVGGTGLYLSALTEGLAPVPAIPPEVRAAADTALRNGGVAALLAALDPATAARIDRANPARIRRAWEVLAGTGRGLAAWQADTPPPLLAPGNALLLRVDVAPDALALRIARRFEAMLARDVLDEVRAVLPGWDPVAPWAQAIGAADLVSHLRGNQTLEVARDRSVVATRQYAKRQRTWLRRRMASWQSVTPG